MQCHQVRRLLPLLIDNELNATDYDYVQEHLSLCRDCRELYRDYRRDDQLISQHSRNAPWLPVSDQIFDELEEKRQSNWDSFWAGTNRVAAGLGVAAVLAVVLVSALALRSVSEWQTSTDNSTPTSETALSDSGDGLADEQSQMLELDEGQADMAALDMASNVVSELSAHNLVMNVGLELNTGGNEFAITEIAFDRHLTLLSYTASVESPRSYHVNLTHGQGNLVGEIELAAGEHTGWLALPGVDPATQVIALETSDTEHGSSVVDDGYEVPDLSALSTLGQTGPLDVSDSDSGVDICCPTIWHGVAVSMVSWQSEITDPAAISGVTNEPSGNTPAGAGITPQVAVNEKVLSPLSSDLVPDGVLGPNSVLVKDLPEQGNLSLSFDAVSVLTGEDSSRITVSGAWYLEAPYGNPDRDAASDDSGSTPGREAPSETEEPATPETAELPAPLYFLAQDANGVTGIWRYEPGENRPNLLFEPDRNIRAIATFPDAHALFFWYEDGAQAYEMSIYDPKDIEPVTLENGTPVRAVSLTTNGRQRAYVTEDQQTLWVTEGSEEILLYSPEHDGEGIVDVEWSGDGSRLLLTICDDEGKCFPRVVDASSGDVQWEADRAETIVDTILAPSVNRLIYATETELFRIDLTDEDMFPARITPSHLSDVEDRQLHSLTWLDDGRISVMQDVKGNEAAGSQLWLMHDHGMDAWKPANLGGAADVSWYTGLNGDSVFAVIVPGANGEGEVWFYPGPSGQPQLMSDEAGEALTGSHSVDWGLE